MQTATVLFFQSTTAMPSREKVAGALRYLESSAWPVQLAEVNPRRGDARKALREWRPIGCVIDRGLAIGRNPTRLIRRIPAIYIDQNPRTAAAGQWYIRCDSSTTVRTAFAELRRHAPRHYAFVRHERRTFWNREREDAFRQIATSAGVDFTILNGDLRLTAGLKDLPKPCGLIAANDMVARDVIAAARRADIRLPEELQIVGINNDAFVCQHTRPTLSSVALDFEGAGYLAMATLHRIVAGTAAAPQTVLFGPKTLVRRASTRLFKHADARVTRALDYIAANASDPYVRTDRIAAVMGCSESLANLIFRKVTGHSIRNEIRRLRIETAKRLLADPTRGIAAIPSLCGYMSLPTFARTFKALTGHTPGGWRIRNAVA